MFNYMIVVNDNGELKSVTEAEFVEGLTVLGVPDAKTLVDNVLNDALDAIASVEDEIMAVYERATELPDPERN